MIDYVFRYDPDASRMKSAPRDAEESRVALEEGNRIFSRWMESCRTGTIPENQAPYLVPCTGPEMGILRSHDESPKQKPFAVVVGCSDARVPTEMLFGQGFNNLFVTRVAGNVLGDVCIGSIDFALDALKDSVNVVVVLGHSGCGAVGGAVEAYLEPQRFWAPTNTPSLRMILQEIFVAVRESANALQEVWGPGASRRPGYRAALAEAATCLNAAHSAYAIRAEVERSSRWDVEVLFGVYNIRTHQVSMPYDPSAPVSDTNVNLAHAPAHPKDLRTLALRMAEILRPGDIPPRHPSGAADRPPGGQCRNPAARRSEEVGRSGSIPGGGAVSSIRILAPAGEAGVRVIQARMRKMIELVQGLHDFRPEDFRPSQRLFEQPSRSGKPEAMIITCPDLGIDPYSLIPTNLQDLYVSQNIGNIVPRHDPLAGVGPSSLEGAVALYPLKDVIVCGHSPCGVLKQFLSDDGLDERPSVSAWLAHAARTKEIVEEHYSQLAGEALLAAAAAENVLVQLENLRTIPVVSRRLELGTLRLHGWIYRGGEILGYAPQRGAFVPLAQ